MGAITQYALQVALLLCVFYLLYKWLLSGSTFCRFNRFCLLCLYAVAFLAMPAYAWVTEWRTDDSVGMTMEQIKEEVATLSESSAPSWPLIVSGVYLAGIIVAFILTAKSVFRIRQIIKHGEKRRAQNYTLVSADCGKFSPFSWGRYIVLPASLRQEDFEMTIAHERAHLRHLHWLDLALAQAVIVFNWFNPAAYLIMKELQDLHEFEADSDVIKSGIDKRKYQLLLIRNVSGSIFPLMADSLNHSRLKTRLKLMSSPRSHPLRKALSLAIIPAMIAAIFAMNVTKIASYFSEIAGASLFASSYNEVEYVVEGNNHTIRYSQDGQPASISMDIPQGTTPNFYINKHRAEPGELRKLKSEDVVFVMGDSYKYRFIVKTK